MFLEIVNVMDMFQFMFVLTHSLDGVGISSGYLILITTLKEKALHPFH